MTNAEKKVRMLAQCMGFCVTHSLGKVVINCNELCHDALDNFPNYKFSYSSWRQALKWMSKLKPYTGPTTGSVGAVGPVGQQGTQGTQGVQFLPKLHPRQINVFKGSGKLKFLTTRRRMT